MTSFLISCEYATCAVPEPQRELFRGSEEIVTSTEGWEPGALNLAQGFAMKFRTPLVHADVTRLLIDLGQTGDERWSRFSMQLPETTRVKLADRHERPFRVSLKQRIEEDLRRHDAVLHIMVHTDPVTDGVVVLETPPGAPLAEKISAAWRAKLVAAEVDVRQIGGVAQGSAAFELSKEYPPERYAQIRVAVSQTFFLEGRPWKWETLKRVLLDALAAVEKDF